MIGVCLTGGGIATIFVPFSPTVELLWLIIVIQGTFEGIINIAGQKLILLLWEKDAASPLHILHGGFGIGSFIIPLIANPFLAIPRETHAGLNGTWNETLGRQSSMANNTNASLSATHARTFGNDTTTEYLRESRIEYAYLISAIITLALSAVFYGYHCRGYRFQKSPGAEHNETKMHKFTEHCKTMINPKTCTDGKLFYGIQMFSILFIYYFNIVGGERILGKFIRAYAIEQLDFSVSEGSYINTTFWISFAVGRISGFIAARYIPIRMLILIETGGVFVFSILLNIFAVDNTLALWILIQPLGLFHAPCFPSMMGWADFHMEMSGMAITFLLLGGSCGGVAYLKITGFLFETYGPRAFLYHILGYGIACISLAILLDVIGAQHGSRFVDMKKDIVSHEEDVEMILAKYLYII
ncbi:MFD4A-like protein [Mya arenaria]|uniref:MFD4A-like protein n=1 Tax=Mya arenaria TaxID=6604 RepID=A0ABY7E4A0_MYAAR|nr:MFD4A-like protein [Mya arenaria]